MASAGAFSHEAEGRDGKSSSVRPVTFLDCFTAFAMTVSLGLPSRFFASFAEKKG